jgi:hypothetical protein
MTGQHQSEPGTAPFSDLRGAHNQLLLELLEWTALLA